MNPSYVFGTSLLAMIMLARFAPVAVVAPESAKLAGLLIMGLGVALAGWASRTFSRANEDTKVVTSGPYRYSRHPMYLGMIISLCGMAVLLRSLTPWAVAIAFAIFVDRVCAKQEESDMLSAFPDLYRHYASQVRRWF